MLGESDAFPHVGANGESDALPTMAALANKEHRSCITRNDLFPSQKASQLAPFIAS